MGIAKGELGYVYDFIDDDSVVFEFCEDRSTSISL